MFYDLHSCRNRRSYCHYACNPDRASWTAEQQSYERQIGELRARVLDLQRRYQSLATFQENREAMEQQLEQLRAEIDQQEQTHEQTIEEMERKNAYVACGFIQCCSR
jgi:chromosome segregation ATPase